MGNTKKSKHEEPIHIEAAPLDVARSLFNGKPKPRRKWLYLKKDTAETASPKAKQ